MDSSKTPEENNSDGESLEGAATPTAGATPENTSGVPGSTPTGDDKKPKKKKGEGFFARFSIYLLLFVLIIILASMIAAVSYFNGKSKPAKKISSQTLSQSDLSQLANSDVTVGDAKQVLNVQSNAVFSGQVLIRSDLQVAGKLQIGGGLSINSITVSGAGVFGTAQVNQNLTVQGDTALQGQLTARSINVTGGGTFSGPISTTQLTASSLQLNGDLNLTHHIAAGGTNPGRSNGSALGSGGTSSVSGSDTAGAVTINTGSGPAAGCFITVNFATKFNSTPRVIVSPVDAGAGGLGYYVTRTTSSFTICSTTAPGPGLSFGFDYIVFE